MTHENRTFHYSRRSGNAGFSLVALGVLSVAFAFMFQWPLSIALLVGIPAIIAGVWQVFSIRGHGVSVSANLIKVTDSRGAECVPVDKVAYLRLMASAPGSNAAFVMRDGKEISLPNLVLPKDMDEIRAMASQSGLPVRAA